MNERMFIHAKVRIPCVELCLHNGKRVHCSSSSSFMRLFPRRRQSVREAMCQWAMHLVVVVITALLHRVSCSPATRPEQSSSFTPGEHLSLPMMTSSEMGWRKRTLTAISPSNQLELEQWFSKGEYPDSYAQIAKDTGLEKELVRRWFIQQRLRKTKLKRDHEMKALALAQSMAPLPYSPPMPYFSMYHHSPPPQYHPMLPPPSYTPSYAPSYMPPLDLHHSYLAYHQSLYHRFQNAFNSPTCYSAQVELKDTNQKQDKVYQENLPSLQTSVPDSSTSCKKVASKFDLCDIKETVTLSQLIDYFLGDFPSKCDSNTTQDLERQSLKRKELETAEFMAQLRMTRELSKES